MLSTNVGKCFWHFFNMTIDDAQLAYFIHREVFALQNTGDLDEYEISILNPSWKKEPVDNEPNA